MFDIFHKSLRSFEVTLLTVGLAAIVVALGGAKEFSIGSLAIKLPNRGLLRLAWALGGLVLVVTAFVVADPSYAPAVVVEKIWRKAGDQPAVQVAPDGDEIYILVANGNVWRVGPGGDRDLVDSGTNSPQIEVAGGVLYVLKQNGNVWSILLHERPRGRSSDDEGEPTFTPISDSSSTTALVAAGESLYGLTAAGEIHRRNVGSDEPSGGWRLIETPPDVAQIASSGTILYYRTRAGEMRAHFPLPEARSVPEAATVAAAEAPPEPQAALSLQEHVNQALAECGRARHIAADGRKLYFVDHDGSAWVCVDGRRAAIFSASEAESVRFLDVAGGIVYVLTSTDRILRYAPGGRVRPFRGVPGEENSVRRLVAAVQGVYVVDRFGDVWRLSESLRRRSD